MMIQEEKLASMWEIVREVAKNSDTVINDYDHYECPFCHEEDSRDNEFKVTHKDTCIVTKARALVADKEQEATPNIQIDRLDGSCPVQSTGTIGDHSAFYFRGRHEQWQFVAGPKELSTDDLVKVQLKMATDDRVFVLEGDDDERMYQDYDHVRNVLQDYAQQYIEWMNERKEQHYQEAIEFARDFKSKYPDEDMEEYSRQLSDAIRALRKEQPNAQ